MIPLDGNSGADKIGPIQVERNQQRNDQRKKLQKSLDREKLPLRQIWSFLKQSTYQV